MSRPRHRARPRQRLGRRSAVFYGTSGCDPHFFPGFLASRVSGSFPSFRRQGSLGAVSPATGGTPEHASCVPPAAGDLDPETYRVGFHSSCALFVPIVLDGVPLFHVPGQIAGPRVGEHPSGIAVRRGLAKAQLHWMNAERPQQPGHAGLGDRASTRLASRRAWTMSASFEAVSVVDPALASASISGMPPVRTRSAMRAFSNSAMAPRMCICNLPAGVVASIPSASETKAMPNA